jgi:outer membrane protein OmpA-like peptidoglycan-associated protein
MPMPLVTPYMVQFAGYKIEKGKLTMVLKYQVEKGQLKAANNILIDQLELGEKVDNPDAVSLPLGLAIALLKDSDGKIKLDVPLTGSLEDPQFSIGGIIFDALVNVLTKIVTSPFNAIASLAGSDEDLSTVSFAPGTDVLDAKEMGKLDGVAKALKEKPVLNIEVKGAAFEEQDWPVLREEALLDQLKATKAAELSKEENKKVRIEHVNLSEDDYNDLLADAFIKQFPTLGEKSVFGTPKLINSDTGDFYKVAKQKLSEIIKPDLKRLKDLASERSQAIAKYIVQKGGVPNERVFILDSALDPKRDGKDIVSALSLKTN